MFKGVGVDTVYKIFLLPVCDVFILLLKFKLIHVDCYGLSPFLINRKSMTAFPGSSGSALR